MEFFRRSIDLAKKSKKFMLYRHSCGEYLCQVDESLKTIPERSLEPHGLMQNAIRAIKAACPEMIVMM
jgi:porphobilinogen synthase